MKKEKAKSQITAIKFDKKVRCACPGCGIDFPQSQGIKGDDGKLYCTKGHAVIAATIRGA